MASFLASQSLRLHNIWHHSRFIIILACSIQLIACSTSKKLSVTTDPDILSDSNLLNAHVGISVYDPSTNKYLYTHQADKYFIPASNTKLFTCYAAMKHLGDSLVGLRYSILNSTELPVPFLIVQPTGDPTFLFREFKNQKVFEFLSLYKAILIPTDIIEKVWQEDALGSGWAWNDYTESYMAERSLFPIYGNLVEFFLNEDSLRIKTDGHHNLKSIPSYFQDFIQNDEPISTKNFIIKRNYRSGLYDVIRAKTSFSRQSMPFKTHPDLSTHFLTDTLISFTKDTTIRATLSAGIVNKKDEPFIIPTPINILHSQPTDSLLKPMMHRSDNFFAEQTLLMVSNEMTGVMNDTKIIDSLLKTDLKDLPQKPRWVDGSGLSRYNLFSPNDMVHVLNKMKNEFDWNRITTILPTGGEGTLSNYYINLKDKIFAKTGTLSNNIALSGFIITRQNKTLIFSVLVNNHMGNTTQIRRAVERFLTDVFNKY